MTSLRKLNVSLYGNKTERDSVRTILNYETLGEDDPNVLKAVESLGFKQGANLLNVLSKKEDIGVLNLDGLSKDKALESFVLAREAKISESEELHWKVEELSTLTGIPRDIIDMPMSAPLENNHVPTVETLQLGLDEMLVALEEHITKLNKGTIDRASKIRPTVENSFKALQVRAETLRDKVHENKCPIMALELSSIGDGPVDAFEHIFTGPSDIPKGIDVVQKSEVLDMLSVIRDLNVEHYLNNIDLEVSELHGNAIEVLTGPHETPEDIQRLEELASKTQTSILSPYMGIVGEVEGVLDAVEEAFFRRVGKGIKQAIATFWNFILKKLKRLANFVYGKNDTNDGGSSSKKKSVKKKEKDLKSGKYKNKKDMKNDKKNKNKKNKGNNGSKSNNKNQKNGNNSGNNKKNNKNKKNGNNSGNNKNKGNGKNKKKQIKLKDVNGVWTDVASEDFWDFITQVTIYRPNYSSGKLHITGIPHNSDPRMVQSYLLGKYAQAIIAMSKVARAKADELKVDAVLLLNALKGGWMGAGKLALSYSPMDWGTSLIAPVNHMKNNPAEILIEFKTKGSVKVRRLSAMAKTKVAYVDIGKATRLHKVGEILAKVKKARLKNHKYFIQHPKLSVVYDQFVDEVRIFVRETERLIEMEKVRHSCVVKNKNTYTALVNTTL